MPSTSIVAASLFPVLLFTLWFFSSTVSPPSIPGNLRDKRIILLIAHPDDESMFFSPALQALTDPALGNHLKILCLSTGNADGLGETRRKELEAAALTLGVRRREDIFIMDDPRFKDGMKEVWDPNEIARILVQAFAPQLVPPTSTATTSGKSKPSKSDKKDKEKEKEKRKSSSSFKLSKSLSSSGSSKSSSNKSKSPSSTPRSPSPPTSTTSPADGPRSTIDILLTFDANGISSHPNHIALHHASRIFLHQIMRDHTGHRCPVDLYTLTTINILRKYTFILDLLPTYIAGLADQIKTTWSKKGKAAAAARVGKHPKDDRVVFVSNVTKYMRARRAMVKGHASQMVWFRWGWIGLGRYMVVNDLRRQHVSGT